MRLPSTAVLGVLLVLLLASAVPGVAEWSQWRGRDGLGVATETGPLPETWEASGAGIRWQVELPGEGISSPIVSNGQVFVTAAYLDSRRELLMLFVRVTTAALVVGLGLLYLRRRRKDSSLLHSWVERWDSRIVLAASCGFALIALVVAAQPDLLFPEGNPGRIWRNGGGVALLGFAAAFGWFARGSRWRPIGAILTLAAAGFLLLGMPSGALGPAGLSKGLPAVFLGLIIAIWYVFSFASARGEVVSTDSPSFFAIPLVVLATLLFVPANFLSGLQRAVIALDLETGEVRWQRTVLTGPPEQKWTHSTYATPTPATDGRNVLAYFGHGIGNVGLDGKLRWSQRFPEYAHQTRYGAGSSPILTESSVIVVRESEANQGASPSWIAAFDKDKGSQLWRIEPPGAHDSYTTPLLYSTGMGTQLLTASWKSLVGYDAASGERLWSRDYPMEQMVASIARSGDLIALTGGAYGDKFLMVLRLSGEGRDTEAEVLWQTNQSVATIASPVFYDGKLFNLSTPGVLTAWDAETGTLLWRNRLDGEYFASLVAGDGKVYAINVEGLTSVVAADSEFRLIAVNALNDRVYASPAIADRCLLIRTAGSLFCVETQPGTQKTTTAG